MFLVCGHYQTLLGFGSFGYSLLGQQVVFLSPISNFL
jgi:hypothetical protein